MEGIASVFSQTLALGALVAFWYMLALFVVALVRRDNSVVDVGWGVGFLLLALATFWWYEPYGWRPVIVLVMVAVWGLRLSLHILMRNWGRAEDWRYAVLRQRWGAWWALRSFLQVFLLQGALMLAVALPMLWTITFFSTRSLGWLDGVGVALWLIGFCTEALADHQLVRFQKNPASYGKVLQSGLWRYSRHPNYFGEILQWWGIWLLALAVPLGFWTILGPLTITFLIMQVSGVPLTESKYRGNAEFQRYAKRTSVLVPWLPKKKISTNARRKIKSS